MEIEPAAEITQPALGIASTPAASWRVRWLPVALAFATMMLFGFIENIKGPAIPAIRAAFQVNYGAIGAMLFVSSLGYVSATFVGGLAGDRFGQQRVLAAGYSFIIAASLLMTVAPSFAVVCALMYVLNLGFGCIEVGVNSLGARIFVRNSAFMMNLVHLFYGLGSMAGPEYAARLLVQGAPWSSVYAFTVVLVVIVFGLLALTKIPGAPAGSAGQRVALRDIVADKRVWLFVAALGLLEVMELGTANWMVSYLQGARSMAADESARYLSLFFIAFTAGRLFGGYVMERVGYVRGMLIFAAADVLLFGAGIALGNPGALLLALTGFFVSVMFPTVMAVIMKEYPAGTSSVMGFVITAAMAVNMLLNWVIGQTSDLLGVTAGFASVMLYGMLAIIALIGLNRLLTYDKAPSGARHAPERIHL